MPYSENILVQESAGKLLQDELGWNVKFSYNTEVLQRLADFVRERMPQHVGALVEILDAAGPALAADGGV